MSYSNLKWIGKSLWAQKTQMSGLFGWRKKFLRVTDLALAMVAAVLLVLGHLPWSDNSVSQHIDLMLPSRAMNLLVSGDDAAAIFVLLSGLCLSARHASCLWPSTIVMGKLLLWILIFELVFKFVMKFDLAFISWKWCDVQFGWIQMKISHGQCQSPEFM